MALFCCSYVDLSIGTLVLSLDDAEKMLSGVMPNRKMLVASGLYQGYMR
jgi:hypothetical protein